MKNLRSYGLLLGMAGSCALIGACGGPVAPAESRSVPSEARARRGESVGTVRQSDSPIGAVATIAGGAKAAVGAYEWWLGKIGANGGGGSGGGSGGGGGINGVEGFAGYIQAVFSALNVLTAQSSTLPNQIAQLSQQIDSLGVTMQWQLSELHRENLLGTLEGDLLNVQEALNLMQPITTNSPAYAHSADAIQEAMQPNAFLRYFVERATDGTKTGNDPWKSVIADRPAVDHNLVYDWRMGVPALMQLIAIRITILAAEDWTFRTDGTLTNELLSMAHGLEQQLRNMVDGVRCGYQAVSQSCDENGNCTYYTNVGCADIYSGINQIYSTGIVPPPCFYTPGWRACSDTPGYYPVSGSFQSSSSPTFTGTAADGTSIACASSAACESGDWSDPNVSGPLSSDACAMAHNECNAEWMNRSDLPFTSYMASARAAVLSQMPIDAMRSLISALHLYAIPSATTCASGVRYTPGDQSCDNLSDVSLSGGPNWGSIPVGLSSGSGMSATNDGVDSFAWWAQANPAAGNFPRPVGGDFDLDGRSDIALVGGQGWGSIPVAHAIGDGSFGVTNECVGPLCGCTSYGGCSGATCNCHNVADFASFAAQPNVHPVAGDFDGDGRWDVALVAGSGGWSSVPVAFSDGGGSFTEITNYALPNFPVWATAAGATPVAGDFDGDGKWDIALVGGKDWGSIPIAFSNGDGTFRVTNSPVPDFPSWAQQSGVVPVSGDYNGDHKSDLALTGGAGWGSVPVVLSNGDGSFQTPINGGVDTFPARAAAVTQNSASAGAVASSVVSGDFDGDGNSDIALSYDNTCANAVCDSTGNNNDYMPVAFSAGDGTFASYWLMLSYSQGGFRWSDAAATPGAYAVGAY